DAPSCVSPSNVGTRRRAHTADWASAAVRRAAGRSRAATLANASAAGAQDVYDERGVALVANGRAWESGSAVRGVEGRGARDADGRRHRATTRVGWRGTLASLLLVTSACARSPMGEPTVVEFWAMGREGEVVQGMVPAFERDNPNVRIRVQQIPWSAAHE